MIKNEIYLIFCCDRSLLLLRNKPIEYILHIYRTFQKINERPHLSIIQISNSKHFNDACHSKQIRWKFHFNAQEPSLAILPHSACDDEFRFVYIKSERNQQIAKPKATVMLWPFCQWYIFLVDCQYKTSFVTTKVHSPWHFLICATYLSLLCKYRFLLMYKNDWPANKRMCEFMGSLSID